MAVAHEYVLGCAAQGVGTVRCGCRSQVAGSAVAANATACSARAPATRAPTGRRQQPPGQRQLRRRDGRVGWCVAHKRMR